MDRYRTSCPACQYRRTTVYDYFRKWRMDGTWEHINTALPEQLLPSIGREVEPSAAIIDSQTVKTTEKGGRAATTPVRKSGDANDTS